MENTENEIMTTSTTSLQTGEKMVGSYDVKTSTADEDVLLGYDSENSKVKNFKFSNIWSWIVKKLTTAVISELQTNNKNVVGAINELNSKLFPVFKIDSRSTTYREDFKKWYLTIPDKTACAVYLSADWHTMLIGFKSDNDYGGFIQIQYGKVLQFFCDISNGVFTFY